MPPCKAWGWPSCPYRWCATKWATAACLVLHQYAGSQIDIHAIWPQRAHLSPRVRYIVDGLVACAAQGRFN